MEVWFGQGSGLCHYAIRLFASLSRLGKIGLTLAGMVLFKISLKV